MGKLSKPTADHPEGLRVVLQSTPRFRGPRAGVRQFTDTTKKKVEEYVKKAQMVAIGTAAVAFGANGAYRCQQEKGALQGMMDARTTVAGLEEQASRGEQLPEVALVCGERMGCHLLLTPKGASDQPVPAFMQLVGVPKQGAYVPANPVVAFRLLHGMDVVRRAGVHPLCRVREAHL